LTNRFLASDGRLLLCRRLWVDDLLAGPRWLRGSSSKSVIRRLYWAPKLKRPGFRGIRGAS